MTKPASKHKPPGNHRSESHVILYSQKSLFRNRNGLCLLLERFYLNGLLEALGTYEAQNNQAIAKTGASF